MGGHRKWLASSCFDQKQSIRDGCINNSPNGRWWLKHGQPFEMRRLWSRAVTRVPIWWGEKINEMRSSGSLPPVVNDGVEHQPNRLNGVQSSFTGFYRVSAQVFTGSDGKGVSRVNLGYSTSWKSSRQGLRLASFVILLFRAFFPLVADEDDDDDDISLDEHRAVAIGN